MSFENAKRYFSDAARIMDLPPGIGGQLERPPRGRRNARIGLACKSCVASAQPLGSLHQRADTVPERSDRLLDLAPRARLQELDHQEDEADARRRREAEEDDQDRQDLRTEERS